MTEEKRKRIIRLAELFDQIPEDKQEKIVFGIEMLAAYENEKKSA